MNDQAEQTISRAPDPRLRAPMEQVAERQRDVRMLNAVGGCWAAAAAMILAVPFSQPWLTRYSLQVAGVCVAAAALVTYFIYRRAARIALNWHTLARQIEAQNHGLEGRLLTAIEQSAGESGELNVLQDRVIQEAVLHARQRPWTDLVSPEKMAVARAFHWLSLAALCWALWNFIQPGSKARVFAGTTGGEISITPGDAEMERGASLVVLARFDRDTPAKADLVVVSPGGADARVALVKSLSDPVFGATVHDLQSNCTYYVTYDGRRTRAFQVSVFDYPRLERADADLHYPEYTALPAGHIENTRRITAVEGSSVDLALRFNVPVVSAALEPRDTNLPRLSLTMETNRLGATLGNFALISSQTYSLRLRDEHNRTNRAAVQFVFEVLTNRTPELRLTLPRRDVRPSPLEELTFEGSVWDDFGVKAFGLGYAVAGGETRFVELGKETPARERHAFTFTLSLEDLHLEPDQLLAWFVWADDVGPDGQVRRTSGDLYFGEVRPFEEVFREAENPGGGGQAGGGEQNGPTAKLAELQKQIISATWKLQRIAKPQPKRQSSLEGVRRPFLFARQTSANPTPSPAPRPPRARRGAAVNLSTNTPTLATDAVVVRDAQAQALEQVQDAADQASDTRTVALWTTARQEMEKALQRLEKARETGAFAEALAAEQAAYQALLKLQQHEYQVSRNRSQNQGGGGGRNQSLQRQLEQMDLTQSENRYETQRKAQAPQAAERREQNQVENRLQELARRQQDLNERLKELQATLQEAKTDEERQELRRRLQRLQEEEQQMLADVDELRQRMERPENQAQMSDQRKQLEQTREDVQKSSEAAAQGQVSQALASGTRAQRQLQEMREQMRKESSSQYEEDLRQMRAQARELAQRQQDLQEKLAGDQNPGPRSLAATGERPDLSEALSKQRTATTNLVEHATQVSQQAENSEPLLSRQLYESVRRLNTDSSKTARDTEDDLVNRGLMTRDLYSQFKDSSQPETARPFDLTSALLKEGLTAEAATAGQRTKAGIDEFKRGIEQAAETVVGDDTEALRQARQELERLAAELTRERESGENDITRTNRARGVARGSDTGATNETASVSGTNGPQTSAGHGTEPGTGPQGTEQKSTNEQQASNSPNGQDSQQRQPSQGSPGGAGEGQRNPPEAAQSGQQRQPGQQGQNGQGGQAGQQGQQDAADAQQQGANGSPGGQDSQDSNPQSRQPQGGRSAGGARGGDNNGGGPREFSPLFNDGTGGYAGGPLTGPEYGPWSDRLRDVEEMIELTDLRNQVASARDRARQIRQQFKKGHEKPDWAVVRLQVLTPLVEVRDRLAEELARRGSAEALVPLDRDPVPQRYSDLVRRYYEELGRDRPAPAPNSR